MQYGEVKLNSNLLVAFMYADPGSGALMLQLAALAVSSVAFYFRKAWMKVFSRKADKSDRANTN